MANRKVVGVRNNVRIRKDYPATWDDINELQKAFGSGEVHSNHPQEIKDKAEEYGLTPPQTALIYSYTGSWYQPLNHNINHGISHNGETELAKRLLNSALNKVPKFEGETYRAMKVHIDPEEKMKELEKMGTFRFEGFTSTSTAWKKAENWGSEGARVLFAIQGKNGRNIKPLSMHDQEEEVLFKAGTKFKFVGYKEIPSYYSYLKIKVMIIKEVA